VREKVLEYLAESGNISYACKRAGISRETFYKWREERPFAYDATLAIEHGKSFVNDLAHTQLIHNIQQGNMQAVRFQLERCHPDYKPRRPLEPYMDNAAENPVTEINIVPYPNTQDA
jgi:hypothetical protein